MISEQNLPVDRYQQYWRQLERHGIPTAVAHDVAYILAYDSVPRRSDDQELLAAAYQLLFRGSKRKVTPIDVTYRETYKKFFKQIYDRGAERWEAEDAAQLLADEAVKQIEMTAPDKAFLDDLLDRLSLHLWRLVA